MDDNIINCFIDQWVLGGAGERASVDWHHQRTTAKHITAVQRWLMLVGGVNSHTSRHWVMSDLKEKILRKEQEKILRGSILASSISLFDRLASCAYCFANLTSHFTFLLLTVVNNKRALYKLVFSIMKNFLVISFAVVVVSIIAIRWIPFPERTTHAHGEFFGVTHNTDNEEGMKIVSADKDSFVMIEKLGSGCKPDDFDHFCSPPYHYHTFQYEDFAKCWREA